MTASTNHKSPRVRERSPKNMTSSKTWHHSGYPLIKLDSRFLSYIKQCHCERFCISDAIAKFFLSHSLARNLQLYPLFCIIDLFSLSFVLNIDLKNQHCVLINITFLSWVCSCVYLCEKVKIAPSLAWSTKGQGVFVFILV